MHLNILSAVAVTVVSLFGTAHAQQWNAVFTGNDFLDSNNAKIEVTFEGSVADVNANKDKGERFRFPTGNGGILISEAHENHAVGFDPSANEFHADFAQDHFDALVSVTLNGNQAIFCNGNTCIGPGGRPTTDRFGWTIQDIAAA